MLPTQNDNFQKKSSRQNIHFPLVSTKEKMIQRCFKPNFCVSPSLFRVVSSMSGFRNPTRPWARHGLNWHLDPLHGLLGTRTLLQSGLLPFFRFCVKYHNNDKDYFLLSNSFNSRFSFSVACKHWLHFKYSQLLPLERICLAPFRLELVTPIQSPLLPQIGQRLS